MAWTVHIRECAKPDRGSNLSACIERCPRQLVTLADRHESPFSHELLSRGKPLGGAHQRRVNLECLLEISSSGLKSCFVEAVHLMPTAEVQVVSVRALERWPVLKSVCTDCHLQCPDNTGGDPVLDSEHVAGFLIVCLRPEVRPICGSYQLRCHPQSIARFSDTALDNVDRAKCSADRSEVSAFAIELK